jgi:hypothetical protein
MALNPDYEFRFSSSILYPTFRSTGIHKICWPSNFQAAFNVEDKQNTAKSDGYGTIDGSQNTSEHGSASTRTTVNMGQNDHELFESFQHKVRALIEDLFPGTRPEMIELERISGACYNRVIGVNIQQHSDS